MPLSIAAWNVFNRVDAVERLTKFVTDSGADVFAFQELTQSHIRALRALRGYSLHTAEDFWEGEQVTYLGVLTKAPIIETRNHCLNPLRTVSSSPLGRRMRWIEAVEALCVTVNVDGGQCRIVNVHLPCAASPDYRRGKLSEILAAFELCESGVSSVLLGDFNCFARPWLNWLVALPYGFRCAELACSESRDLDTWMRARGFVTREHRRTSATYPLVLDRIFARRIEIEGVTVSAQSYGSDHFPIGTRLSLRLDASSSRELNMLIA